MPHLPADLPLDEASDDLVHARRRRTLGVLCPSLTIVMSADMSLNLALPAIASDLHASTGALQWMVDAYALVFAGLLFTAGTLGDRDGRKGALQVGLVLFLVGSVAAMTAPSAGPLIAARALMGVAAAFVMRSTLSIITNVFRRGAGQGDRHEGRRVRGSGRPRPGGVGAAARELLVGVGLPRQRAAGRGGSRARAAAGADLARPPRGAAGAARSIVGLGALVYAIIEAPHRGWTAPGTVAALGVAAAGLGLLAWRETTAAHPMLDLHLFPTGASASPPRASA